MPKYNFQTLNRRFHLYLGMFCLPWFLMYGVTSLAFNHGDWFGASAAKWVESASWECTVPIAGSGRPSREELQQLVAVAGLDIVAYGGYRPAPDHIIVFIPSFLNQVRLVYFHNEGRLASEKNVFSLRHFLTGMHARGGFHHDSFLHDAWAVMVDIVCSGFVLWVTTGTIIWWRAGKMRLAGFGALLSGIVTFAGFMLWL